MDWLLGFAIAGMGFYVYHLNTRISAERAAKEKLGYKLDEYITTLPRLNKEGVDTGHGHGELGTLRDIVRHELGLPQKT